MLLQMPVAAPGIMLLLSHTQKAPPHLQVQSAAELSHMAQCHTTRLLVVHFASPGCELDEVRAGA